MRLKVNDGSEEWCKSRSTGDNFVINAGTHWHPNSFNKINWNYSCYSHVPPQSRNSNKQHVDHKRKFSLAASFWGICLLSAFILLRRLKLASVSIFPSLQARKMAASKSVTVYFTRKQHVVLIWADSTQFDISENRKRGFWQISFTTFHFLPHSPGLTSISRWSWWGRRRQDWSGHPLLWDRRRWRFVWSPWTSGSTELW